MFCVLRQLSVWEGDHVFLGAGYYIGHMLKCHSRKNGYAKAQAADMLIRMCTQDHMGLRFMNRIEGYSGNKQTDQINLKKNVQVYILTFFFLSQNTFFS